MNRLQALHDAGVSIWLDNLSRELLDSGAFAALIGECAVTGAACNTLHRAQDAGIDLDAITAQLEREGVRSFCGSYEQLLGCLEAKLEGKNCARADANQVRVARVGGPHNQTSEVLP